MGLFVQSITLREAVGGDASFPDRLRHLVCSVLESIEAEELAEMLSKHESDRENFDGRVEARLRQLDPSLLIEVNRRISQQARYDNDLVIESEEGTVIASDGAPVLFDIIRLRSSSETIPP